MLGVYRGSGNSRVLRTHELRHWKPRNFDGSSLERDIRPQLCTESRVGK
jgi:hypothetical protein